MNKLADVVLQGWIDALNELVDMGVIPEDKADLLFDNATLHAKSVAHSRGLDEELLAFANTQSEDYEASEEAVVLQ